MSCSSAASTSAKSGLSAIRCTHIPHQVPYLLGLSLQEHLVSRRARAREFLSQQPSQGPHSGHSKPAASYERASSIAHTDHLLLLEHTPVYTEGRRQSSTELSGNEQEGNRLRALGADYVQTRRGGLVTYHGPGQLVGYPIWDIGAMDLSTRCYVDKIQAALTKLLHSAPYHLSTVPAQSDETGVWSDISHKIASIGIQVRHRITSHGFALNVGMHVLPWFEHIVACGIVGKGMTSIERERALLIKREEETRPDRGAADSVEEGRVKALEEQAERQGLVQPQDSGRRDPRESAKLFVGPESRTKVEDVVPNLVQHFSSTFGREIIPAPATQFVYQADAQGVLAGVTVDGEDINVTQ
ncbi:lipoyltransferase [Ceraceosorus guamensis]|uniref:lipoyl(octanoyl) transferase n=1 Tax=Ceraceosorus guamensis TaxID=1522189 RepID=A0A316W3W3_9BASI|nr:lipoyltransferase [Ceraceosorus guamensis]PWN42285.1 lipoyltransferase [Ceraceosorus guamensis]